MAVNKADDKLGTVREAGYSTAWDFKGSTSLTLKKMGTSDFRSIRRPRIPPSYSLGLPGSRA